MVALRTTADRTQSAAAPYPLALSASHALVVEVLDAVGSVRDTAHLQHCVYLTQEFGLLPGRRYWFALDAHAGLPYSHLLDDHVKTLLAHGVVRREPLVLPGQAWGLRACATARDLGLPALVEREGVAMLGDLAPDDVAALAGAAFALSHRGHHPTHRRFQAEVQAELRSRLGAEGAHGEGAARAEGIVAVCRRLSKGATPAPVRACAR